MSNKLIVYGLAVVLLLLGLNSAYSSVRYQDLGQFTPVDLNVYGFPPFASAAPDACSVYNSYNPSPSTSIFSLSSYISQSQASSFCHAEAVCACSWRVLPGMGDPSTYYTCVDNHYRDCMSRLGYH
jgi:hypothetical protein